jgi:hypothetical protein
VHQALKLFVSPHSFPIPVLEPARLTASPRASTASLTAFPWISESSWIASAPPHLFDNGETVYGKSNLAFSTNTTSSFTHIPYLLLEAFQDIAVH